MGGSVGRALARFEVGQGTKSALPLEFEDLFYGGEGRALGRFDVGQGTKSAVPLE